MVLNSCKFRVGVSSVQTAMIMQALHRCTMKYDANLEVNAYDMEPVAKRARKGRKNSATVTALAIATTGSADGESNQTNEPDEDRIKIGIRRLQAISNVLSYSTSKSHDTLQMHLVWAGDYAMSALSDDVLGSSFFWPNSLPPEQALADQATLIARDAAAH